MKSLFRLWPVVVLATLMVFSLLVGGVSLSFADFLSVLAGSNNLPMAETIILDIRLPRVILSVIVGAGIAASGAAIQGLFRNPLADPALIGVASGAALFAAMFVVLGGGAFSYLNYLGLAGSAFAGSLFATWIVLLVGTRSGGISTMLLAGIAINAIALAGVGLLSYAATDGQLRSVTFWALGSFNGAGWTAVTIALVIPVVIALFTREAANLNAITLGSEEAGYLGVSVRRLQTRIVVLTAVCVGVGVALSGVIAFIGLIVPHLVRMTLGSNHATVIPFSATLGGALLLVADTLSRTVVAPIELPVGILTALVGGPFFIYLIVREGRRRPVL